MKTFKEFLSEDQWYNEPQFKKPVTPVTPPGSNSGMTIGEYERRVAAGEIIPMIMKDNPGPMRVSDKIIPMNVDDDPFIKAQKRMGEAQYKRKLDAQRRRGRPPTPEEEAADNLRYSVS